MSKKFQAAMAGVAALLMIAGCSSRSAKPQTSLVEPTVIAAPMAAVPPALLKPLKAGDEVEYAVSDKFTGNRRTVVLRVDRVEAARVLFNNGARIEKPSGEPLQITTLQLGDMDAIMPPGGWGRDNLKPGMTWSSSHRGVGEAAAMAYSLKAEVGTPVMLRTPMGALPVVPIEYWGWATDKSRNISTPSKVSIDLWYSVELRRVVRMETHVKPATNLVPRAYESSRELSELVAIRHF
ncbi:MAG: hypothetical protein ABW190_05410 [Rhizobacter sp.]